MSDKEDERAERKESDEDGSSQEGFHRRGFFREGFRQLLKPLADIVEDRMRRVGIPTDADFSAVAGESTYPGMSPSDSSAMPDRPVLRPPGALAEEEFLDRCLSSAQCVSSCPVNAIKLARSDDPRLDDKPFIDAVVQACVVCEDLSCMHACPSGALVPVSLDEIDMGTAEIRDELCLRTQGEDCQICVDKCPIGKKAIEIPYEGGSVDVHEGPCTGCGVCEMYCPTEPRAIVVIPVSESGRSRGAGVDGPGPPDPDSYYPMGYAPGDGED